VGKLGNIGGVGKFLTKVSMLRMNRARKETLRMNRRAKIVCRGCYHSLDTRSWVLRKMAPFCNRGDLSHTVENSGVFGEGGRRKWLCRRE